ncbi:MAG TPA: aminotransferase class III-fold pyridoxal phosphate-dependent enzyme [Rhizomicrobium sp.]|nr:aminotransferase class III-fold pyridoxal phosphate-dependent enzyme [Rhizomicrobium sp.]
MDKPVSAQSVLEHNRRYIPGGISSVNRSIDPAITFVKGEGAYLWDSEGKRYIDYHAGFAPYFLGHNFRPINDAAAEALASGDSLFGAGPSIAEGRLAELICEHVPAAEKITFLNTGSEATSLAIRIARAVTGRSHVIVMQGGYNGNHDELALNVFNTAAEIGPRVSPGEYPLRPLGAGTTITQTRFTHAVNYNDLESVRYVCRRYPVAALITEPLLQNIGVVKPGPGYLEGLRDLADEFGFLLVFDEVKTGFRHALGGYAELSGVAPDLVVYGKAVANGFPLAAVGGKRAHMDSIIDPDPARRPFVAGTYNGHPVAVAAAIETVRYLIANRDSLYPRMEAMGAEMERGIMDIFARRGIAACVARQGSAFSFYLMEKPPADLHDIIEGHDFARDVALRRALIQRGVFFVPIATKQCSLSAAHSDADVRFTLDAFESAVAAVW